MPSVLPRVVIVGGGFGGLHCARALAGEPLRVLLVDRRNFHLFQPLLYQVATGALSPANICAPLRKVLAKQDNAEVILAEARGIDPRRRVLLLADGEVPFHHLVLAAGSATHYFGNERWEAHAPGLKSIEDAQEIRRRVLLAFEEAERTPDPGACRTCLRFVVVGGGPTGVELAGALAEIARYTLRNEFRNIRARSAEILLLEGGPRVLPSYPGTLSEKARASLEDLGVTVIPGAMVREIGERRVVFEKDGRRREVEARTILWTAGVAASPLARAVARDLGAELDRGGRVRVGPDATVPGHPEVTVLGDMARFEGEDGLPLPGVAPVAIQQGEFVARRLAALARGKEPPARFRYRDRGSLAVIGRRRAVVRLGERVRFSGGIAWVVWLLVHLLQIVEFGNRLLILVQWAWNYLTFGRAARLITDPSPRVPGGGPLPGGASPPPRGEEEAVATLDARHGRRDTGIP